MTNPNNAVGTNAAYDGRTSVKAFNDGVGAYSRGIISGWACSPNTGMTVSLGGDGNARDVAIAQDSGGNKTTINNISESPINVTLSAAPASNSRIDAIVAYVDNPPQGSATVIDNPAACGLIAVEGTIASTPVAPNESAIRAAITADGASGATAYYVVLATVTVASGTTDLVAGDIENGSVAQISGNKIDISTMAKGKILSSTAPSGAYSITDKGMVYAIAEFVVGPQPNDVSGTLKISGNSGSKVEMQSYQFAVYSKGQAHTVAFVSAGDSITITQTLTGNGSWSNRGFLVFVPMNW